MINASLILLGETGNGKSSLGNFILNKQVFSVSDNPESETKETKGEKGDGDNAGIFVIDTPGLQDAEGTDRQHLIQMVEYIKSHPGLQGIILVFNYHQDRFPLNVKTIIQLLCNMFPCPTIWSNVALVWTKYYYFLPKEVKQQKEVKIRRYLPEVLDLVRATNGDPNINSFPTFFIDSDFEQKDLHSCEEVNRLIAWVHQLDPIDEKKVRVVDPVIKETVEEKDERTTTTIEGNVEHIKIEYFKRKKQIYYDGSISYTDWIKYNEKNKDKLLPKEVIETHMDRKKEENYKKTPDCEIHQIDWYERTINVLNDGTVEYGEWRKYDSKTETTRIKTVYKSGGGGGGGCDIL
ncbi:P-loop containing nucleoside triphosphate hydrolase protein [Neocallimastix lanati (nom. inval.)]|jgi:hypothetical protein|uniref:p-loop containing nucleoside triphosphate hydrolase protein n=1 Tax=Neocallimastix californiae TaxID=1754190 RepID=A0A1Y2C4W0_9FUNG|nr:P-loop containing nucleoside triphosphate hydrolase protein [Neocallimastix sp. JGI-2020a]ORY42073.1 P-loop containing nucleoside triphosphate hydrolase protein [Neocallimastix californiae]|eukprot:ORY42073.1 P-loop containing nucleoside triphosphate hydrolase protein [Neocallimastix californiae]